MRAKTTADRFIARAAKRARTRQTAPAGRFRARIPIVLFPSIVLVRIEISGNISNLLTAI